MFINTIWTFGTSNILQSVKPNGTNGTLHLWHHVLFCSKKVACITSRYVPPWLPSFCPLRHTNLLSRFLHNEGETHKSNAFGNITSAVKPNQTACLFTLPMAGICLSMNKLRLGWMVTIQGITVRHTNTHMHYFLFSFRLALTTHTSPEIAFLKWPYRSMSGLLSQP